MNIKVAARVRPFNQREVDKQIVLCIAMNKQTTTLLNIENPEKNMDFTFDHNFQSFNSFEIAENGYRRAVAGSDYADQQAIFQTLGQEILNNALEGYHCCLLAYGQTGAGKTYTMTGQGANKGIVPLFCEQLFEKITNSQTFGRDYEVNVSMFQIYNEKLSDLFVPFTKRPQIGSTIREHKIYGVYVEGLTKYRVDSYESIKVLMEQERKSRDIENTTMDVSSARCNIIMQIELKTIQYNADGKKRQLLSMIQLADLSGSEQVKFFGQGDRLQEQRNISKSLSTLRQIIIALAEKEKIKEKQTFIPYRDSKLTRIFQNAFGGNSKTAMIFMVNPGQDNYEQTLSTLQLGHQAKDIKNNAVINETDLDKLQIEQLNEIQHLKQELIGLEQQLQLSLIDQITLEKFSKSVFENQIILKENFQHFQSKSTEYNQLEQHFPYIVNLNENPLLDRTVMYLITLEAIHIGRSNGDPLPQIIINSRYIEPNHAVIINNNQIIQICSFKNENSNIFVNGQLIFRPTQLVHNDRIIFGKTTTYLVQVPGGERDNNLKIDWEFAQLELLQQEQVEQREKQSNQQKGKQIDPKKEQNLMIQAERLNQVQFQCVQEQHQQMLNNQEQGKEEGYFFEQINSQVSEKSSGCLVQEIKNNKLRRKQRLKGQFEKIIISIDVFNIVIQNIIILFQSCIHQIYYIVTIYYFIVFNFCSIDFKRCLIQQYQVFSIQLQF